MIRLIRRLRDDHGLEVVLYPFVMMDIPAGNGLPDPVTGGMGQPHYPWRGRITCMPAPGSPGSVDGTAAAEAQVAALLGTVSASDMSAAGEGVSCASPDEWSYRRFVLHHAMLAQAAGGVSGFVLGSEMIGLTRLRGEAGCPMVDGLVDLANEVKALLPSATLTYAADWTEYGAHVRNGGQDVTFPLDPLWASPAIGAIGIDFYPPLSDWRDTGDHADAAIASGPNELGYLRARLNSGEAHDWYYADAVGRLAQTRLPITDGAHGKPWVFRQKDLVGWWSHPHVERAGGAETTATAFRPGEKPIWLTEIGVPAVDKGANAPNVFPDAKSAESGYPHFSSGARDDLVQARGLEAIISGFDPAREGFEATRNPVHPVTGVRMIDPANIFVWSYDARPFPAFPDLTSAFGPTAGIMRPATGSTADMEGVTLDRLVLRRLLADYGLPAAGRALPSTASLDGYVLDRPISARQALEPLAQAFGFDAVDERPANSPSAAAPRRLRGLAVARTISLLDRQRPALTNCAGHRRANCRASCASFYIDGEQRLSVRLTARSRRLDRGRAAGERRRDSQWSRAGPKGKAPCRSTAAGDLGGPRNAADRTLAPLPRTGAG